jgi:ketosteroid isomerase-like protein
MWTKPAWASCRRPPDGTCTDRLIIRRRTVESAHDIDTREVLACDESFFAALLAADHDLLGTILADDFLIVDVLSGQVARRDEMLGATSSGQLRFAEVTRYAEERSVRLRSSAAVVAGRTQMVMRYQGDEVTAQSRYTHVYTRVGGGRGFPPPVPDHFQAGGDDAVQPVAQRRPSLEPGKPLPGAQQGFLHRVFGFGV